MIESVLKMQNFLDLSLDWWKWLKHHISINLEEFNMETTYFGPLWNCRQRYDIRGDNEIKLNKLLKQLHKLKLTWNG